MRRGRRQYSEGAPAAAAIAARRKERPGPSRAAGCGGPGRQAEAAGGTKNCCPPNQGAKTKWRRQWGWWDGRDGAGE
eukprot:2251665-Alexandrium_andersonii.AAC.1